MRLRINASGAIKVATILPQPFTNNNFATESGPVV